MRTAIASEMPVTATTISGIGEIGDDMLDLEAELPSHLPVREAVEFCNRMLTPVYKEADARALRHQKWHRRLAIVAALLGTIAVLLSLLPLTILPGMPTSWEAAAVAIAGLAVASGLLLAFQSRWQVERNKAERCRLLKFRFLTDAGFWCGDAAEQAERRDSLKSDAAALKSLNSKQLEEWMREEQWTRDPAMAGECRTDGETLRALLSYYRSRRLETQKRFFEKRLTQLRGHHKKTWRIPSWLFLGSVIAALGHSFLELIEEPLHIGVTSLSKLLILLAAGLPVIAAGVRTFRSTYEFARNAMRYEAKLTALRALDRNLGAELDGNAPDRRRIFHDLWCCEQVMEFEHREWLRLMIEAEWY